MKARAASPMTRRREVAHAHVCIYSLLLAYQHACAEPAQHNSPEAPITAHKGDEDPGAAAASVTQ